ncbi:DUF3168 domain-containing protein [Pseudooceanicola nitratireducens]|jgi:hypothetical protein|uniref:DUF3168 domain-containing protein n=1 Tax=Pseudooceanicola nitratireducens TaxID=517719 RepID=UPI0023F1001D|nr:DUF3168 domain-containing protein [Pseudooceanicola nitratireducens]
MSASVELQTLIYQTLVADPVVGALVDDRIYDGRPDTGGFPCVTFGASDYVEEDSQCITARVETINLDVWARSQGKLRPCKEICDAVKDALHEADLSMALNALVRIEVTGVRVFVDEDGLTAHGVVTVEADIEEA